MGVLQKVDESAQEDDLDYESFEVICLLSAKVGQMAEFFLRVDGQPVPEESKDELVKDMLGATVMILAQVAHTHDVSLEEAVENRFGAYEEDKETEKAIEAAMDDLDVEKLADELGLTEDGGDDYEGRSFQ